MKISNLIRKSIKNSKASKDIARTLFVKPTTANTDFTTGAHEIEYTKEITKHRTLVQTYDIIPFFEEVYIAPSATVIGEVILAQWVSIWHNAVLRGEINLINIGDYTSIGDNTVIQTVASLPTGLPAR